MGSDAGFKPKLITKEQSEKSKEWDGRWQTIKTRQADKDKVRQTDRQAGRRLRQAWEGHSAANQQELETALCHMQWRQAHKTVCIFKDLRVQQV